jgi:hypothetical protein
MKHEATKRGHSLCTMINMMLARMTTGEMIEVLRMMKRRTNIS